MQQKINAAPAIGSLLLRFTETPLPKVPQDLWVASLLSHHFGLLENTVTLGF